MTASIIDSITKTPKKQKIRGVVRHAIDVDWLNVNPVPDQGEVIYVTDKNTLKVGDGIHKYSELPAISGGGADIDLSKIINKADTLPTPSADNKGYIYIYAGDTTSSLTHGYIYECKEVEIDSYDWVRIDVQPRDIIPIVNDATITLSQGGVVKGSFTLNQSENETIELDAGGLSGDYVPQYSTMPAADASQSGKIVEYIGTTDSSYINGYFYKCVENSGTYSWARVDTQPTISVINNVTSTSTVDALSANMGKELQDEINNLKARGRYLSLWNCATGLAQTDPTVNPYNYATGDYFIVGTVAASGQTNYRPDGSSYTIGVASTTVETNAVSPDDTYIYDGTHWILQYNTQKTVTFANIAGQPTDNSNLAAALNAKANAADLATVATTGDYDDLLNKPTIPAAQVNSDWDAVSGVAQILNKPTLGTMAAESASDYTKTSGLATVATSGDYDDLTNKPTIPAAQVNSDWNASSGVAEILNKPTLGTMASESASDYTKTSELNTQLANKVDKTSDANKVYATDSTGAQTTIAYDRQNATPSTIVQRDLSGQINIPLVPTADKHAASKQYVDNTVADKVSKVTPSSGTSIYAARSTGDVTLTLSESNTAYTVPYRTSTGQINVAQTPTSNNNATSKKYVDDSIKDATITITQGGVTKGSFTVNQSTNATIALDAGGSGADLPSQTGHGGEFLKTDGTNLSWDVATTVTYREWGANE